MNELYRTLLNPKGKFGIWGTVLMVVLGISLLVLPGIFLDKGGSVQPQGDTLEKPGTVSYSLAQLENDIALQAAQILTQVEGAGKVAVSVTLQAGVEQAFAQDVTDDKSTVEERDSGGGIRSTTTENKRVETVFAQGGSRPLVVKEIGPTIKGVLVVAEGAKDGEIKSRLTRAVQAMLNVPAHRVMVLPKESR